MAHNWLSSYISNRKQFVSYNDTVSDMLKITCGVPQGSILGPLLFILYINDLCNVSKFLKCVLFADDTNLFASGNNINTLCEQINDELSKINKWFSINKLSLNLSKTNFIIFSKKSISEAHINIEINNVCISRVYECKFLGVIIDSKLNWKSHIARVKSKLMRCNAIMYKAKLLLNTNTLRTLYCSLFLPYLNYCCEVWGVTYKSSIESIYLSKKKAVRIICKTGKYDHTNNLFIKLGLLKFYDLVNYKVAIVMYKANKNSLPYNVQSRFNINFNNKYTLGDANKFKVVRVRTILKSFCISIYGVTLFNGLSNYITGAQSLNCFKKLLKNTC